MVSGFAGSSLDRLLPRLIAREVENTLTAQGEDRIETISQNLQAVAWQGPMSFPGRDYSLGTENVIILNHPDALLPQARQHIADVQDARKALKREQFYRYVIGYWRLLHIALALLSLLLIIWHLIYVVQLLSGFGGSL